MRGGLVVVLGCDRPSLLAELRATGPYLVHGLDRDLEKVAAARNYLLEKKLYGSVTVSQWDGRHLPFVDGVVNLVVIGSKLNVTRDELLRVLAPNGVSVKLNPGTQRLRADTFFRKPWPAEIAQWSHFLYDASNNAVSNDTIVDPPKGLRWTCGPKYARSHEHLSSLSAMVTAGGRLFYIIDEGPISSVYLPPKWKLVARDAFSGVLLWERSIENWEAHLRGFRSGPPELARRLVAAGDNVAKAPPNGTTDWIVSSGGRNDRQDAELVAYSVATGAELWRASYSENYNTPGDIFVINGVVWVGNLRAGSAPGFTVGRDLKTGKVVRSLRPQRGWGHHRCYRNKATVQWLLVGRGGVQFIDPESGNVIANSWYRGACQYGVMPANGLLYVPQHSCACQPEELLTGLNALSPKTSQGPGSPPRLEKGPAFASPPAASADRSTHDWPTYRCNTGRSGYNDVATPRQLGLAWKAQLTPPLTAPVVAGARVFVAETNRHALYAFSAADGKLLWTFIADGRIDSPPTVSAGRCLFGTRSGYVYCLRGSDGALIWRFRGAPRDRRLFSCGQLESVWPVHGSVLVVERPQKSGGVRRTASVGSASAPSGHGTRSVAYFVAGRSARLDGGIRLYALDVATGQVLHQATVRLTGRAAPNVIRRSALPDILSLQNGAIWMRGLGVDRHLKPVADEPHLFAPRGFLDDTRWHRTYWLYGTKMGGGYSHWPEAGNARPAGRLLVYDGSDQIYGYGRLKYRTGDGHVRPGATRDYRLFAEVRTLEPQRRVNRRGEAQQVTGPRKVLWSRPLPFVASSLVLTHDALLVAGGASLTESAASHGPGTLWVVLRGDGSKEAEWAYPAIITHSPYWYGPDTRSAPSDTITATTATTATEQKSCTT